MVKTPIGWVLLNMNGTITSTTVTNHKSEGNKASTINTAFVTYLQ